MQVGKVSKAIIAKALIDSQYLVSPRQSDENYEWNFMPGNMTVVLTSSSYPFSISPSTMPASTKVTSTLYSSTSSLKNQSDSRDKEESMQTMKKKKTNIGSLR